MPILEVSKRMLERRTLGHLRSQDLEVTRVGLHPRGADPSQHSCHYPLPRAGTVDGKTRWSHVSLILSVLLSEDTPESMMCQVS